MKHVTKRLASLMFLSCLMLPLGAQAQVDIPQTITIAGEIEAFGANATSTLTVEVAMFDVATGGTSLWNEEVLVTPNQGYVELELGSVSPLGPAFEGGATHIEIKIGNETLSPRLPISALPYAHQAGNSNRLEGKTLAEIKGELADEQSVAALIERIEELEEKVAALEAKTAPFEYKPEIKSLILRDSNLVVNTGQIHRPGDPGTGTGNLILGGLFGVSEAAKVTASNSLIMGTNHGLISGSGHIISGGSHNVSGERHVVLGGGSNSISGNDNFVISSTQANVNGANGVFLANSLGTTFGQNANNNVVIQAGLTIFDGPHNTVINSTLESTTASEMVVIGSKGANVSGTRATVIGGDSNIASGDKSIIIGGLSNTTSGTNSAAIGGSNNEASGNHSTTLFGTGNTSNGINSTVFFGANNTANAEGSLVVGGETNQCMPDAENSIIFGGSGNTCTQSHCSFTNSINQTDL